MRSLTLSMFIIVATVLTLQLWPYRILEVYNLPFPTSKEQYAAGEAFSYIADYKKTQDTRAEVTVQYLEVDGDNQYSDTFYFQSPKGTYRHAKINFQPLPIYMDAGKYEALITACYFPNPFKTVCYDLKTTPFTVTSAKIIYIP